MEFTVYLIFIQAFIIAEGSNQGCITSITVHEACGVVVYTEDHYVYLYVEEINVDTEYVKFSVQACNDAHIALSQVDGQDAIYTYEIVIGGWTNSKSVIRDVKQGPDMNELSLSVPHAPLDCYEKRSFWISWFSNYIKVGTGSIIGNNVFMAWNDASPHPINFVAFSTGWGSTGMWSISSGIEACSVMIYTRNEYVYKYVHEINVATKYVTFKVQACNDAHIALSQVDGLDTIYTYEIVIGGWSNSKSVIRDVKQGPDMNELSLSVPHAPLNCHERRPFWISWFNNYIEVGTGNIIGNNVFMAWNDTSPHPINFVAFSTGWGSTGIWSISTNTGN